MARPTVYRYTDIGAPQLFRMFDSYKALLQSCLIDGYGTKPGAGWSIKPFIETDAFVLRQGGTNPKKHCIKFHSWVNGQDYCRYNVAEDFTDINTPVNEWSRHIDDLSWPYPINGNDTRPIPWMIIATARSVYFHFGENTVTDAVPEYFNTTTSTPQHHLTKSSFFGDYKPLFETDLNTMIWTTSDYSSSANKHSQVFTNGNSGVTSTPYMCTDFTLNRLDYSDVRVSITGFGQIYRGHDTTSLYSPNLPNHTGNHVILDKGYIGNAIGLYGIMPGFLQPLSSRITSWALYSNLEYPSPPIDGADKMYVFNGYGGQVFVHDGEWGVE